MLLPLFHNVLVLITAENLDAPMEGRVIEVGPQALYLLVGDVVRFANTPAFKSSMAVFTEARHEAMSQTESTPRPALRIFDRGKLLQLNPHPHNMARIRWLFGQAIARRRIRGRTFLARLTRRP